MTDGGNAIQADTSGRRRVRIGERVALVATVRAVWTDSDAARRKGDDGHRCELTLPSGAVLGNVRVVDLAHTQGGDG